VEVRTIGEARQVVVIGTGLVGTSVALALRERGAEVRLADRDPFAVSLAVELGAGEPLRDGDGPADIAVLAVPPAAVAATLLDAQKRDLARVYTDVASVKARPLREAAELGCDLSSFVAGHLFLGRPWALCPTPETSQSAVAAVAALAEACGAQIAVLDAEEHDRAVALVSHGPHVAAAAVAARLQSAPESALGLAGQGVRDVTRIAAGDPELWIGILSSNAAPVADVIDAVAADLAATAAALRAGRETAVTALLERGGAGRHRLPGKHGDRAGTYAVVSVVIPDRPGELALLFQTAGVAGVNIEDVMIEHSPGRPLGVVELSVKPDAAQRLADELRARGWSVPG
jgi:prephenate dehydrogenase